MFKIGINVKTVQIEFFGLEIIISVHISSLNNNDNSLIINTANIGIVTSEVLLISMFSIPIWVHELGTKTVVSVIASEMTRK